MAVLLALACSLVWGTSDFVAGVVSKRLPPAAVVAWSQAIGLLVLTALITVRGQWELGPWGPYAVGAGCAGALALICFYAALSTGTMGVVAPIASLGVAVPVLVGIVRGDAPGPRAWLGVVVAIIGVVLASGPELSGSAPLRPVALAVAAGLGFGLTLVFIDGGAEYSVLHTLWGMRLTSVAGFVVAGLALRRVGGVVPRDLPTLAVVGVADGLANLLFGVASSSGMVSVVSVLASLYPVVTVLLARAFLQERLRGIQAVGVVVTMVGAVAIAA